MTDKNKVHEYLERRKKERREHKPIHKPEEIMREIGWDLIEAARIEEERSKMRGSK